VLPNVRWQQHTIPHVSSITTTSICLLRLYTSAAHIFERTALLLLCHLVPPFSPYNSLQYDTYHNWYMYPIPDTVGPYSLCLVLYFEVKVLIFTLLPSERK
jgi:hypothetical protein